MPKRDIALSTTEHGLLMIIDGLLIELENRRVMPRSEFLANMRTATWPGAVRGEPIETTVSGLLDLLTP